MATHQQAASLNIAVMGADPIGKRHIEALSSERRTTLAADTRLLVSGRAGTETSRAAEAIKSSARSGTTGHFRAPAQDTERSS
ncbi:hypothetical protein [Rhizobium sp. AN80A]|uniref:hypothetical protein n=1 Tax=Rhizobium sp. AN80A TaxID=3040673 RepID=UPI0024B39CCD|nr:hypothetical protein [Rhizobium sp. AN80A]